MEINTNFSSVKLGETICYHIGNLAADRIEVQYSNGEKTLTDEALFVEQVAATALSHSTKKLPPCGSGEFELKQKKVNATTYAYLAKRIKFVG